MVTLTPPNYGSLALPTGPHTFNGPDGDTYDFEKPVPPVEADTFDDSFKIQHPKYNDQGASVAFLVVMISFIAVTIYCAVDLSGRQPNKMFDMIFTDDISIASDVSRRNNRNLVEFIVATVTAPVVFSMLALILAYTSPIFFVFFGFFLIPLTLFTLAATCFSNGLAPVGVIFAALGVYSFVFLYQNQRKLKFTALMLKIVIEVMRLYPSTVVVSLLGAIVSAFLGALFYFMSSIIYSDRLLIDKSHCSNSQNPNQGGCTSTTTWITGLYLAFVSCLGYEVLKNVIHVSVSGVYGTWYFFENTSIKPRKPAWSAFKRAMTFSFGSICYGSLMVALVDLARSLSQALQDKVASARSRPANTIQSQRRGSFEEVGLCLMGCLVALSRFVLEQAESLMRWFNQYAYSYLALYGKPYLASARDTFEMMKYKGVFIMITDCLISATIKFYTVLIMLVSSGFFLVVVNGFSKHTKVAPEFLAAGFILQGMLNYFITSITLSTIQSGFITFLVALCIKPEVFEQNYHDHFVKMTNYYPEVSRSINIPFPESA